MPSAPLSPEACAGLIREAGTVVALTGAGISTAAGIPDFRGPEGLYNTGAYDADRVFDINYFRRDPTEFYRFTRDMLALVGQLKPTFTHDLLARMEREGLLAAVITQNIDPLHRMAGTERLVPIHGDFGTSHCLNCGRAYSFDDLVALLDRMDIPRCDCAGQGLIKPDVVFFGEMVEDMPLAQELATSCDLMLVLGSSLVVYPAALLPQLVRGPVVVVNKGPLGPWPGGAWHLVEADLDAYFRDVAAHLFPGP